jgi:hypothetical protein
MKVFNRKSAAVPEAAAPVDIQRLQLEAAETTLALKRARRSLNEAQQDLAHSDADEKKALSGLVKLLTQNVEELEIKLAQQSKAVSRAEAQTRQPKLEERRAEIEALLPNRTQIVAEVDRSNKALAAALEKLNVLDEQIYQATAGRERSVFSRMGDRFHPVERRARFYNSLPLCWPSWIRHKFQSSYARSVRDKKTLVEYEQQAAQQLLARLEQEIKSLKQEANSNAHQSPDPQ